MRDGWSSVLAAGLTAFVLKQPSVLGDRLIADALGRGKVAPYLGSRREMHLIYEKRLQPHIAEHWTPLKGVFQKWLT